MAASPAPAAPQRPSPFLPGTKLQYVWDSTSLGWLKTCPRYYQYQMIEGWRRRGTSSVHLVFGQHYHAAIELYDKLRFAAVEGAFDHDTAVKQVLLQLLRWTWDSAAGGPWEADHPSKNRFSLLRSVVWYLDEYRDDPVETIRLANGKPAVELTFKFDSGIEIRSDFVKREYAGEEEYVIGPSATYLLSGHLDRLATFAGETYVLDHKTSTSALDQRFFDGFNPSNQMTLYTLAGKVVYQAQVRGVMIAGAQVGAGFTRFGRSFTLRTEAQLVEYLESLRFWLAQAETFAAADFWPMNETACANYGGCPFRKICSLDPAVRQRFLETDFERSEWNPLVER